MDKKGTILMQKYELGRLLGQGTFAKVYYGRHIGSSQSVAIKIVDKAKVLKVGLINQIKREISVMRLVKHPNIVQLYEVMASKTKIYFAMEYVKGGELFNKVSKGRLKEDEARKYFQQLISAVDFCHSRGVYHRDLKPENLLLDENGDLKITDFGLSAFTETRRQDGLLHTTCGTPAYVAPEVINKRGYDGAKADIWSCGVVLYVLLAGFLPFHDTNLMELYKKVSKGEFRCPGWFPSETRKLLARILDPSPTTRITVQKLMGSSWFKRGFKKVYPKQNSKEVHVSAPITPRDVKVAFELDYNCGPSSSKRELEVIEMGSSSSSSPMRPTCMNAFDIISLSPGFDLSGLFDKDLRARPESRFTTAQGPSSIVTKFEEIAQMERFKIQKKDGMVTLESNKEGRKGLLKIDAEIFEVGPTLHMLEVKKAAGDTIEYNDFCDRDLKPALSDIVWTWQQERDSTMYSSSSP